MIVFTSKALTSIYRSSPAASWLGLLALALTSAVMFQMASPAGAFVAQGSLAQLPEPANCVGETTGASEGNTCGTLIETGTGNAFEVQLSPDGKNAYSVSVTGDLIEYSRNLATGALTVIGCVTAGTDKCASENVTQSVTEIANPTAIALSPDGKNAYVTSSSKNAIVEFERNENENGLLTLVNGGKGCVTEEATGECEVKEAKGLHEPYDLAVSPNGENVYATAVKGEAVAEFKRNTSTGVLEPMIGNECIGSTTSGCPASTTQTMSEPIGVVVSSDEKNVYVDAGAEKTEGAVFAFERGAEGALEQLPGAEGCIGTTTGCTESEVIQGSEDLAITPDGKNIYSTSANDDAIIELERTSSGALTQLGEPDGCLALEKTGPATHCTTAKLIRDSRGVTVSPDGKNVYVGSAGENGVAEFARNSSGVLEQLAEPSACLTSNATGCGTNEVLGLKETRRVAVSPDGTNVYVAGQAAGAIAEFDLITVPTVTRINPAHGSPAGGTELYIKGSGFTEGDKVLFGAEEGTEVVVTSASTLRVKSPAPGKEEKVAVRVENAASTSPEVPADEYSFTFKPTVLGVTPSVGSESGGTTVTITGSEFLPGSAVDFGGIPASNVIVESTETIKATSPVGTGAVDVTVKTTEGTSASGPADKFTYVHGVPKAAGGLVLAAYCTEIGDRGVTLEKEEQVTGPGFAYENWACAKTSGEEELIANTGASPSTSMVAACEAANPGATVFAYATDPTSAFSWGCYTIVPPATVTTVEPAEGSTAGGAPVTIKGTNLEGSTEVTFGGVQASEVAVKSNTEITARTPAQSAGVVDVCVTATGGQGCKSSAYTYVAPPKVTSVEPSAGPETGSTRVIVKGEHLTGASEVRFGASVASEVDVISATELTANSPAHASGAVDVVVVTVGGESAREAADHFTYQALQQSNETPIGNSTLTSNNFVAKTASVSTPVLAVSGNVAPVSGTVLVRLPGSSKFVPLLGLQLIPFGTVIDATHGKVTVTTVGPNGKLQSMTFFEGQFKLTQGRNGVVIAELTGGDFSVCPTARERAHRAAFLAAHTSPKHAVRKLWAEGHGSYTTKGNYAAGAVLGTRWLTEDLCDGTLIHVATDKVAVTDLVNHKKKTVKAGHSFLAKAP